MITATHSGCNLSMHDSKYVKYSFVLKIDVCLYTGRPKIIDVSDFSGSLNV